jgi:hypothetical protein
VIIIALIGGERSVKKSVRGCKPYHDDCLFMVTEKLTEYQFNTLLGFCTEIMWDDDIPNLIGFRVNNTDWDSFAETTLSEGVVLVKRD